MTPPNLEYTTRCRIQGCGKQFVSSPMDIPIIGQPNDRVIKFVTALMEHVQKKHPQAMLQISGAIQEYMGFLIVTMFQCEDPRLAQLQERVRASIAKVSRRITITDEEITDKVARLELDPDEEEGLNTLLRDIRDLLCEQGRYAPENQTLASSPLITP